MEKKIILDGIVPNYTRIQVSSWHFVYLFIFIFIIFLDSFGVIELEI